MKLITSVGCSVQPVQARGAGSCVAPKGPLSRGVAGESAVASR